jgi:hypothetical protein
MRTSGHDDSGFPPPYLDSAKSGLNDKLPHKDRIVRFATQLPQDSLLLVYRLNNNIQHR